MDLLLPKESLPLSPEGSTGYWPVFGTKQIIKKFWNKKKDLQTQETLFEATFIRIGKKKQKPKPYFFSLSEDYVLSYYKKKGDKSKGSLQLDQDTLMCLSYFPINFKKTLGLRFFRSDKTTYLIYTEVNTNQVFELWELIHKKLPMNNFEEMYQPISLLGKGSFATVYKVKKLLDDQIFAAKIYYKETFNTNSHKAKFALMIQNEVMVLAAVNHPGIATLHEVYQQMDKVVVIMEHVQGPDLYQILKTKKFLSESKASYLLFQITESLQKLHLNGFVHRDLKLENILLQSYESYETKIVDFGFAERINPNILTSKAGTPGYIPPELYANKPYTDKGDIFSLGVLLFSLVGGYSPFKGRTYKQIMEQNQLGQIIFDKPIWTQVSNDCKELILLMCDTNPVFRLSATQILEHRWIRNNNSQVSPSILMSGYLIDNEQGVYQQNQVVPSFYQKSNCTMKSLRIIGNILENEDSHMDDFRENAYVGPKYIEIMQRAVITFNNSKSIKTQS